MLKETGSPHPAAAKKPTLRSDCHRYFDAFRHLSVCRLWDQVGPQPIQISEVKAYLGMVGIADAQTSLKYLRLIQMMDGIERNHIQKKQSKASK